MKILPRKIANEVIQDKKRQQIDEGLLIAKKVDALRGSMLELENQRAYFIEQNVNEINKATSQLYADKQELENEIKALEKERKKLQEPLDKEWENLSKVSETLKNETLILADKKEDFKNREINLKKQESDSEKRENTNILIQKEFERLLDESNKEKQEADSILKEAEQIVSNTDKDISKRIKEVLIKEERAEFDLKANKQITFLNELRGEELNKREIQLKDREETLKRNLQRIKQ